MKCNYKNSLKKQKAQQEPRNVDLYYVPTHLPNWKIEEMTGYKPITSFYMDFSIADLFGKEAILDTFKRAMNEWKTNYKYLTELVMAVNWKSWEHYEKGNMELMELYADLYYEGREYALDNLKGEELHYYFETTD